MKTKLFQIIIATLCIFLMYACQQEELLNPLEEANEEEYASAESENPIHSRSTVTINAQNNNGADIAATIQSKVHQLRASGGGTIEVDFGTRKLNWSRMVVLYDNIRLSVNKNTKFYTNNTVGYMVKIGTPSDAPQNVTIQGGQWIGDKATAAIIYVENGSQNITIEGAEVRKNASTAQSDNLATAGIKFRNGSNASVKKCVFRNLFVDIFTVAREGGISNLDIIDNDTYYHYDYYDASNNRTVGGGFVNMVGKHRDVDIRRNIVRGYHHTELGGHLITTNPAPNGEHFNVKVIDNAFYCANVDKAWDGTFNGASGDVIAMKNVNGFEVSHNAVFSSGEYAITAVQNSKNGTIHHNTIVESDGAAIVIGMANRLTSNVDVYKNYIYKTAMDREGHSDGSTNNCTLNAWHNIRVWSTSDCKVRENVMENIQSFGLYIRNSSDLYHNKNYYHSYTPLTAKEKIANVTSEANVSGCTAGTQSNNLSNSERLQIRSECHWRTFSHTRNNILNSRTNNIFK